MTLLAAGVTAAFASGKTDFARYERILSRQPFGEPPAPPSIVTVAPAVAPAPGAFARDFRMCAITETAGLGVRVGFVNVAAKKNYYLRLGEAEDGIQLVEADYGNETALLQRGAETYRIKMSDDLTRGGESPQVPRSASLPVSEPVLPQAFADIIRKVTQDGEAPQALRSSSPSVLTLASAQASSDTPRATDAGGGEAVRAFQSAFPSISEPTSPVAFSDAIRQANPAADAPIRTERAASQAAIAPALSGLERPTQANPVGSGQGASADKQQEPDIRMQFWKLLMGSQMDVIRARGQKGPALPVPLTKEMDDQLVAEGVLPP